jgi:two-component system sensor histidine kinase ChvG
MPSMRFTVSAIAGKMNQKSKPRRFYQSLRFKLLLVSLTLLVIPLAGYRFIQDVEFFLRAAQEQNLLTTALSVATQVQAQANDLTSSPPDAEYPAPDLYVHPLDHPPTIDGYDDDWQSLEHNSAPYRSANGAGFDLLLGETGSYLYLLLEVSDKELIYNRELQAQAGHADQVELAFTNTQGQLRHYLIAPQAPGWVTAYRYYPASELLLPPFAGQRIKGQWQETVNGYNLELKIPGFMLNKQLAIRVLDQQTSEQHMLATSMAVAQHPPGLLIRPSPGIQSLLKSSTIPHHRTWVVNTHGLVVAKSGQLGNPEQPGHKLPWLLHHLLSLILRHQADSNAELPSDSIHLRGEPVSKALQGHATTWRRRPLESDALILSAAYPIKLDNQIAGAVMVEQTSDAILSIQNKALWNLLTTTLTLFLLVSVVLLGFASLLTGRIRRLHKQMEQAVTADGRIVGEIQPANNPDEIGELGRGFASALSRLSEYNRYLEAMASRLTHELRTPLTVVRTSLESHEHVTDPDARRSYLARARNGTYRLDLILRQLQEATRLEKAMQHAELSDFDLCELARFNTENFASIHPDIKFVFKPCVQPCMINGSPELVSQALEKLVNNAVDFHQPGTGIQITVTRQAGFSSLCVSNQGPLLPAGVDLFQSMVSVRKNKSEQPHMGLGLYLVKLIAEFHHGQTSAGNLPDGSGAAICFSLSSLP